VGPEIELHDHLRGPSVTIPLSIQSKALLGLANEDELDLFMSLHAFGLQTQVLMSAKPVGAATTYTASFEVWETKAFDRYDWDATKHLTVPNPDFRNPHGVATPVAPNKEKVRVYHSNAKRIEAQALAKPYDAESYAWTVTDRAITESAVVDAARAL
jgi:hypothetical protein